MIIYKATNKIDGKSYIGQTVQKLKERAKRHLNGRVRRSYFRNALLKHGMENFTWEVLEKCDSKKELDEMEFHYIKQYDTHVRNGSGYNLTWGGEGTHGFKMSEETKDKLRYIRSNKTRKRMSRAAKNRKYSEEAIKKFKTMNSGIDNGMYGKKHSEKTLKLLSKRGKVHNKGERNPMYGKTGENNPNYGNGHKDKRWLVIYPDGKEVETSCLSSFARDYEKETGIKLFTSNLTNVANGKIRQYKGLKCKKW